MDCRGASRPPKSPNALQPISRKKVKDRTALGKQFRWKVRNLSSEGRKPTPPKPGQSPPARTMSRINAGIRAADLFSPLFSFLSLCPSLTHLFLSLFPFTLPLHPKPTATCLHSGPGTNETISTPSVQVTNKTL